MTDDDKKGAPARPAVPRSMPPRPPPPVQRPSGDRHAAVAHVAALVDAEVELTEEISVAPPAISPAAKTGPAPNVAAVAPVVSAPSAVVPAGSAGEDSEARHSRRFPFEINVDIVSEHNFYAGLSLNISEGGLFIATHVEYPVGTKLEIRLLLPGDEEPTALKTEVRWVRPHNADADGAAGMGLRFLDLSPPMMAKIAKFAQSRDPLYYEDD
jgi:uncharacterized protein (TIGR02266 family)